MTDHVPIGVAAASSLDTLNGIVAQREDTLGPLVEIGNNGTQTMLVFDADGAPPSVKAKIATGATGGFCQGKVFISGQLLDAHATR